MSPASLPLRCNRPSPKTDERQGTRSSTLFRFCPGAWSTILPEWRLPFVPPGIFTGWQSGEIPHPGQLEWMNGCVRCAAFVMQQIEGLPFEWMFRAAWGARVVDDSDVGRSVPTPVYSKRHGWAEPASERMKLSYSLARPCAVGMGPAAIGDSHYRFWWKSTTTAPLPEGPIDCWMASRRVCWVNGLARTWSWRGYRRDRRSRWPQGQAALAARFAAGLPVERRSCQASCGPLSECRKQHVG